MDQKDPPFLADWNIFVRELQSVLQKNGLELKQLGDHVSISQYALQRLIQSANTPPELPILSEEEMKQLSPLIDPEDAVRLKAALLAIAVQRELMLYMWRDDTQRMAEQIFPIIFSSLKQHDDELDPDDTRHSDFEAMQDSPTIRLAARQIDSGLERLRESKLVMDHSSRVSKAYQAHKNFTNALNCLDSSKPAEKQKTAWRSLDRQVRQGLAEAESVLRKCGEIL